MTDEIKNAVTETEITETKPAKGKEFLKALILAVCFFLSTLVLIGGIYLSLTFATMMGIITASCIKAGASLPIGQIIRLLVDMTASVVMAQVSWRSSKSIRESLYGEREKGEKRNG